MGASANFWKVLKDLAATTGATLIGYGATTVKAALDSQAASIATNTSNISSNTTTISSHTTSIAALSTTSNVQHGRIGTGAAPSYSCDITDGGLSIIFGGDSGATTRTNSTNKRGNLAGVHYTNAQAPVGIVNINNSTSDNVISIGGGTSSVTAATQIDIYAAGNNTTASGTRILHIRSSGLSFDNGANFLANYEIGTWTPVLKDTSSNSATMAAATKGAYERIGKIVHFSCTIEVSSIAALTSATDLEITGLPFTSAATHTRSVVCGAASSLAISDGNNLAGIIRPSETKIALTSWVSTTGTSNLQKDKLTSSSSFFISGTYRCA